MRVLDTLLWIGGLLLIVVMTFEAFTITPEPGCYGPRPGRYEVPSELRSVHWLFFGWVFLLLTICSGTRFLKSKIDLTRRSYRLAFTSLLCISAWGTLTLGSVVAMVLQDAAHLETHGGCFTLLSGDFDQNHTEALVYWTLSLMLRPEFFLAYTVALYGPVIWVLVALLTRTKGRTPLFEDHTNKRTEAS